MQESSSPGRDPSALIGLRVSIRGHSDRAYDFEDQKGPGYSEP